MKQTDKLLCSIALLGSASIATATERPNVLVILSDDMGYSDIGCFGGVINTPNLDALAENGIRFTQFYNSARSCPSRASLLTGLYPHQTGIGHMTNNRGEEGYRGDLTPNSVTLAEVMKESGYETFALGKWHVTRHMDPNSSKHNWPRQRGFDHYYGTIAGAGSFYDPNTLCRENTYITPVNDEKYQPETFYYTNAITDNALMYLDERQTDKPFFMYLAYTCAHWPMHALEEDIAPYKGKFDSGWDALRVEKFNKLLEAGIIKEEWGLAQNDGRVTSWEETNLKEFEARCMEVYAAMISNMDANIGRVISYLEQTGELDNTLIIYLQDNGACAEPYGRESPQPTTVTPPNGVTIRPMGKNELQDRTIPYRTRDGKPVRCGMGTMPGPYDTYVSYGEGWASASNTPFRGFKRDMYEGGISTPLIVSWRNQFKAYNGQTREQPTQLQDIMATLVDVAGTSYPQTYNGHNIIPMEGSSLLPAVYNPTYDFERTLYGEHEGHSMVRRNEWKAVYHQKKEDANELESWELYNINNDRTEKNDLAKEEPEILASLVQSWNAFAERCQVIPFPKTEGFGYGGFLPENFESTRTLFDPSYLDQRWSIFGQPKDLKDVEIVANPSTAGINTSNTCVKFNRRLDGEWWAGFNAQPAGVMKFNKENRFIHIMMLREENGTPVCIKFENGTPIKTTGNLILPPATDAKGKWVDYVFQVPENLYGEYAKISIMPDFVQNENPNQRYTKDICIYVDEIVLNNDPEPRTATTDIVYTQEAVICDFENGFPLGNSETNGNHGQSGVIADSECFYITDNPYVTPLNCSDKAACFIRKKGGLWWSYACFPIHDILIKDVPKYLHVKVNKPIISDLCIQLKDRATNQTANSTEIISSNQAQTDTWEDIVFRIDAPGKYSYLEFKPDFENPSSATGDINIYFDDIIINDDPNPRTSNVPTETPLPTDEDLLEVFPTVTAGWTEIQNRTRENMEARLYVPTGTLTCRTLLAPGINTLDLSKQPAGTYILKAGNAQHSITTKIVKK